MVAATADRFIGAGVVVGFLCGGLLGDSGLRTMELDICELDVRGTQTYRAFKERGRRVRFEIDVTWIAGFGDVREEKGGIECSTLVTRSNAKVFVIGSRAELVKRWKGQ